MRVKSILILMLMFWSAMAQAQKVALVLSGGGAKGLAHTGVIKALEENGIPIDYIVGTSMGSIVGGFYAAGYSAEELMEISLSQDMQNWVKGVIDQNYNYYYTRKDPDARWLSAELSLDSVFNASFNTTIAQDHALNFALAEYLAQASKASDYNFDSLFVPYRAMAAEVFTQSEIMLREGHLADALRASMTVPFFFRPIRFNGQFLLDGGIYNNFPVDVAIREFNPDIIIGVNVASKVFKEYPYGQDEKLMNSQLLFLMLDKSDPEALKGNIYIEPDLGGFGSTDFAKAQSIVDSGYVATMRQMEFIKEKIARRVPSSDLEAKRTTFTSKFTPLYFDEIEITGFNKPQTWYLNKALARKNKVTALEEIKAGYYKIVSEDYFRSIYPRISRNDSSGFYKLQLFGSPSKKLRMALGGTMTSRSTSNLTVGAEYKRLGRTFTHYDVLLTAGRFYQSAKTSMRMYFPFTKPFYLEPEYIYNAWDYTNSTEILLRNQPPTIVSQADRAFRAGISIPLGTYHKLTFSPGLFNNRSNYANSNIVSTDDVLDELRMTGLFAKLRVSQNNLDYHQYPTRGESFESSLGVYSAAENYSPGTTSVDSLVRHGNHAWASAQVMYQKNVKVNRRYGYGYQVSAYYSTFPHLSNFRGTLLQSGGYYPLPDSKTLILENFRSNKYIAGGMRQMFFFSDQLHFRLEGHFFKPIQQLVEAGGQKTVEAASLSTFFFAGSAGIVYHSPVGPIAFNANYYDDAEQKWGALFHVGYLLFNKKVFD